jgi:hypothetical protein
MNEPPQKEARPAKTAPELTHLLRFKYHSVALLAILFETPFWFFEQRKAQLQDRISNEGSAQ